MKSGTETEMLENKHDTLKTKANRNSMYREMNELMKSVHTTYDASRHQRPHVRCPVERVCYFVSFFLFYVVTLRLCWFFLFAFAFLFLYSILFRFLALFCFRRYQPK